MGMFILWKTSEIRNFLLSRLCIRWFDLYNIYNRGKELKNNLRNPPKLSYLVLHAGNNKQNLPLAIETTITAARSYFPNWRDVAKFLTLGGLFWNLSKGFHHIYLEMLWSMGTKNWVFKSSGRLDWTNTWNCICIDYYF